MSGQSPGERRPKDGIEAAVFEVYRELLDRPPSPAECAEWAGKLLRGVPVRELRALLETLPERQAAKDSARDAARIMATGLFDGAWYQRRYPDVARAGGDPVRHYAVHGVRDDRAPNPYFDPVWYRATHRPPPREPPLLHYAAFGEKRGLRPSEKFDPVWYRAAFDLPPEASPLADFLRRRRASSLGGPGVAPTSDLWPALGLRGLRLDGARDDVFLAAGEAFPAVAMLRDSGVFDENFYALHSGDVLASGADLLTHYCEFGWRERRMPNFYFDSAWYIATNPEVARMNVDPLAHYLIKGEPSGRRPIVFFDPVWYRSAYQIAEGDSPLGHFLAHRREGAVSPNEFFDPAWYFAQKGETFRPGRDPFARFLVQGMTEDFSPSPRFDLPAWRRRAQGRASRHFRHLLDPARDNPLAHYLLTTYR